MLQICMQRSILNAQETFNMEEIRLLTKDDIDVRVSNVTDNNGTIKVMLLLYKDARVDMKILDELYTPMGWKRTHKLIGDRLYCSVEVYCPELGEWISKEDVGTESNTEAEKGQASDSFKRACVNWGIGRELYSAPRIYVTLNQGEYYYDRNNRLKVSATFSVSRIEYDVKERVIKELDIVDKRGSVRYSMTGKIAEPATQAAQPSQAVQARRKAANRPAQPAPAPSAYTPVEQGLFNRMVENYVHGVAAKDGGDYRTAWINYTHAGEAEVAIFDNAVQDYIYSCGIQ